MRNDMNRVVIKGGHAPKQEPFLLGRLVAHYREHANEHLGSIYSLNALLQGRPVQDGYLEPRECLERLKPLLQKGVVSDDFQFEVQPTHSAAYDLPEPVYVGRVPMRRDRSRARHHTVSPVERWLAAQVGRPWADVYAEVSKKFVPNLYGTLREWVAEQVATNCYRNDAGEMVFCTRRWGVQLVHQVDYYVDPESGLLCATPNSSYKARVRQRRLQAEAERAKAFRKGAGDIQYHKRDGVWYEVHVASFAEAYAAERGKLPFAWQEPIIRDTFRKCRRTSWHMTECRALYGGEDLYSVSHRALSRREAKKLGLH